MRVQEALAAGDGSTALALNMHLIRFGAEREGHSYPPEWFDELCRGAVEDGRLVNTAATEEGLGSPAGGGIPDTTATPVEGGWVLDGRKTFVTLAPELWYMPVLARLDPPAGGPPDIADFMVLRDDPGARIDETWDALGMRASGSHDLVLEGVRLPQDRFLGYRNRGKPSPRRRAGGVWFALGVAATNHRRGPAPPATTPWTSPQHAYAHWPSAPSPSSPACAAASRASNCSFNETAHSSPMPPLRGNRGEDSGMPASDRVAIAKVDRAQQRHRGRRRGDARGRRREPAEEPPDRALLTATCAPASTTRPSRTAPSNSSPATPSIRSVG